MRDVENVLKDLKIVNREKSVFGDEETVCISGDIGASTLKKLIRTSKLIKVGSGNSGVQLHLRK